MTPETVPPAPQPAHAAAGAGPDAVSTPRTPRLAAAVLTATAAGLAFLLASTPAHNSDLWLHLAAGRALVRGQAAPGTDPFASTTAGILWVHHSWLTDMTLYGLYEVGDGRALVVAKALLAALLAALFFSFRRPGKPVGMLAVSAAAAVVALGPWLQLQPALLSLLGVILTLYLLERPDLVGLAHSPRRVGSRWLLLPLFALWANLDSWFVLGPLLVGLYAVGALFRRKPGELSTLTLLTAAGLAACLLTPFHYHTFAWPAGLGWSHTEQALAQDPLGQGLVFSPFAARGSLPAAFASPGGWAYCLLLVAGAASFVVRGKALHPGRLLAWLTLAALSIYQARAIPFFAAAAGPILALNLREWAASRPAPTHAGRRRAPLLFAAGAALLVLAWPGWLQPTPYQPRGWYVAPDESLVRMAGKIEQLRAEGQIRPKYSSFTFSPEAANYLAWFCPDEKGFVDSRWPLFDRAADDYVRMRRCLLRPEAAGPDPQLGPLLDAHGIDRILVQDPDLARTTQAFGCLLLDGEEWALLAVDGDVALFGRRQASGRREPADGFHQPAHAGRSPWKTLDLRQAAYHPESGQTAPLTAPRAPQPSGLLDTFWRPRDEHSADRGEAALDLVWFDAEAARHPDLAERWILLHACGLLGIGPATDAAGSAGALAWRLDLTPQIADDRAAQQPAQDRSLTAAAAAAYRAANDQGPPETLLLAVRAARRALAANPDDAGAYLLLGEAYFRLANQTRELFWGPNLPELAALRHAQTVTALEQAVLLRPDLDRAHELLVQIYLQDGRIYRRDGQLDRALEHLRSRLDIADQEIAARGPRARDAADRKLRLRADADDLQAAVNRALKIYEANATDKTDPAKVFERASLAARRGLTRKAYDMLHESSPAIYGDAGLALQLDLMMQAGRAFEVRAWLEPGHEELLGFATYHSLQAQAAAACGDYAAADAELETASQQLRLVGVAPTLVVPTPAAVAVHFGGAILACPPAETGVPGLAFGAFTQYAALQPLGGMADLLRQGADAEVLRGLLTLESGAVDAARAHFRTALTLWGDERKAANAAGLDFASRPVARHVLRLLEGTGAE